MEKPSCIDQLKKLTDSLSDRDVNLKKCMTKVKEVLHNEKTTPEEKVKTLKDICNEYGNK